jgi:hypothetical protein
MKISVLTKNEQLCFNTVAQKGMLYSGGENIPKDVNKLNALRRKRIWFGDLQYVV